MRLSWLCAWDTGMWPAGRGSRQNRHGNGSSTQHFVIRWSSSRPRIRNSPYIRCFPYLLRNYQLSDENPEVRNTPAICIITSFVVNSIFHYVIPMRSYGTESSSSSLFLSGRAHWPFSSYPRTKKRRMWPSSLQQTRMMNPEESKQFLFGT